MDTHAPEQPTDCCTSMSARPLTDRFDECVRKWNISVETTKETEGSFLAFGIRGDQAVVLKVIRAIGEEWQGGQVLEAFASGGTVRVLAHVPGAVLLERLNPGTSLVPLVLEGRDDEATVIIADVIHRMSQSALPAGAQAKVEDWGHGFRRYLATGDRRVPIPLVERAQQTYLTLCASQLGVRLLHGDLHHYNVLLDSDRGWLAIDPKGVIGEIEYEVGASLRNPVERPELFTSPQVVARRLKLYAARLKLDVDRALHWAFAQAVLSALWSIEDGAAVGAEHPTLKLAESIQSLLG
jgi:streptomycin 6-kinase